jgi:hypothetical protein
VEEDDDDDLLEASWFSSEVPMVAAASAMNRDKTPLQADVKALLFFRKLASGIEDRWVRPTKQ